MLLTILWRFFQTLIYTHTLSYTHTPTHAHTHTHTHAHTHTHLHARPPFILSNQLSDHICKRKMNERNCKVCKIYFHFHSSFFFISFRSYTSSYSLYSSFHFLSFSSFIIFWFLSFIFFSLLPFFFLPSSLILSSVYFLVFFFSSPVFLLSPFVHPFSFTSRLFHILLFPLHHFFRFLSPPLRLFFWGSSFF